MAGASAPAFSDLTEMTENTPAQVIGREGLKGTLAGPIPPLGSNEPVDVTLITGETIAIPFSLLRAHAPGIYRVSLGPADLQQGREPALETSDTTEQVVVPVLGEDLQIHKRAYPTGGVRVNRVTEEHDELVEVPLVKQAADIRRVFVDKEVYGPQPVRYEGDTTIIPVVEETLVVTRRFVLKEEIHVTLSTREEIHQEQVTLKRQRAEVERVDESGNAVAPADYVTPEEDERPYVQQPAAEKDDRPFAPIRTNG